MWTPVSGDDWEMPDDGETLKEMEHAREQQASNEADEAKRNERLWQLACDGLIARDGRYLGRR